ncbi:TetR family transcriptional regulator [Mycolicibacterium litorale]|nr:TetR family transcriptional regulator [Mycolicibacterium litorale]
MKSQQKAPMGRPREFDPELALQRAMEVFWEQGYEGATLTDLTAAMGISRTSMYAAFGNKEALFARALERYVEGPASYGLRALQKPTAREVAAAILKGAIRATTNASAPAGCLTVQGSLAAGGEAREIRDMLAAWRNKSVAHLTGRFRRAVDEGDLPDDVDAAVLARYVITVANGIAVQAASGASRADLNRVADVALRTWPMV